jgi:hypothetical protein
VFVRLLQHFLIWLAATLSIILGAVWGQTVGFLSHRTERRLLAWVVLTVALIFAGGLVQRMPLAVAMLVACGGVMCGFGVWLVTAGAPSAGLVYVLIGLVYLIGLGPSTYRWFKRSP